MSDDNGRKDVIYPRQLLLFVPKRTQALNPSVVSNFVRAND